MKNIVSQTSGSATVQVWGRLNSANVQKVLWCLDDLGTHYHLALAGGIDGGLDTPEFIGLNPNRLVPVIIDEGTALWESNVIVRYLCKKYGQMLLTGPTLCSRHWKSAGPIGMAPNSASI